MVEPNRKKNKTSQYLWEICPKWNGIVLHIHAVYRLRILTLQFIYFHSVSLTRKKKTALFWVINRRVGAVFLPPGRRDILSLACLKNFDDGIWLTWICCGYAARFLPSFHFLILSLYHIRMTRSVPEKPDDPVLVHFHLENMENTNMFNCLY